MGIEEGSKVVFSNFSSEEFAGVCRSALIVISYCLYYQMALVWSELALDAFLAKRADTVVSPVIAQR